MTFNLADCPANRLGHYHLEAQHPDDFVLGCVELSPGTVVRVVEEQISALRNPPFDLGRLLDTLRGIGLVQSVARLRELLL